MWDLVASSGEFVYCNQRNTRVTPWPIGPPGTEGPCFYRLWRGLERLSFQKYSSIEMFSVVMVFGHCLVIMICCYGNTLLCFDLPRLLLTFI